ncbi:MAG: phosphoglucosamine mutase [Oscillospiraceae bacterium]|jgi:phosphoglucosamine mutase|nr:phosphoglucosamine mutase [Oscillospiraceae bacterium]
MGRIFGTDGVRGIANTELSCKLAMNVGRAAAMVIAERIGRKPTIVIGKDTRISSDMLEAALAAGLTSVGADVVLAGVLPTPAISCIIAQGKADAGIMLSASHNSYEYNGIKIFGPGGVKLPDSAEFEIEQIVLDKVKPYHLRWGWELGRIVRDETLAEYYIGHIAKSVNESLSGLRVAVDCSNGSASATAASLFSRLGVRAEIISDQPNGVNINRECGSTHMERLKEHVAHGSFDAGIAFDGDADRCLAVDETGKMIDGDVIMAIIAKEMKDKGTLRSNTLVATVMSNLGLFRFAEENGINVLQTKVGDRYVLEQMLKHGYNLGGEQSGHVILAEHMPTGDGQLTAITLLSILKGSGKKLSELAAVMKVFPQVMVGIQADPVMKSILNVDEGAKRIIEEAKHRLGGDGRILVRASGTEPLIRVMVEGVDEKVITILADEVAETLRERLSNNEDCKKLEGF